MKNGRVMAGSVFFSLLVLTGVWAQGAVVDASSVLAWIPYVRVTPEYDNVVKILGFRPTETKTTDPAELELQLAEKSVLIIPEQQETDETSLEDLGNSVSDVLVGFLKRGGRIVGMTFGKGADDILRGAGIWSCGDGWDVRGANLAVALPGDPLADGVAPQFTGPDGSTDFSDVPEDATIVVWDPTDGAPVVFQWTSQGGTIVMLGFDFFAYNEATARLLRNAVQASAIDTTPTPPVPTCAVHYDLSAADIERLLTEMKITFERGTDKVGDPYWSFPLEGTEVFLTVDDQTAEGSGRYQFLQFYVFFLKTPSPSCATINDWNLRKRGSRAYLDADNDPVLESDLYLRGGVTWDTIKQFVERFGASVKSFKSHIGL